MLGSVLYTAIVGTQFHFQLPYSPLVFPGLTREAKYRFINLHVGIGQMSSGCKHVVLASRLESDDSPSSDGL